MKSLSLLLCFGSLLAASAVSSAQTDRPNIVVILVDDMGWSDIGCYGGEIATPNLDRLAANGVRFTQFYNTGRCCPTRASLLTGLYSHQAGVGHMTEEHRDKQGNVLPGYSGRLNDKCVTMAEVLKGAGYFTAMTGKWHVGQNLGVTPWQRGFERTLTAPHGGFYYPDTPRASVFLNGKDLHKNDAPLPEQWYSTDLWTEYGLKFIDEARTEKKPFFLYLAHNAPHFPLQAPAEEIAKWRGKFKAGWDQLRQERYDRQIAMGLIDKAWPMSPRPENVPAWDSLTSEQKDRYDEMMSIYAAVVSHMDAAVGNLVKGLEQRGVLDNTLILFMSDNGGNAETGVQGRMQGKNPGDANSEVFIGECWAGLNNTPFVRYKHYNDEGGIATPLIAHWPAQIPASRRGQLEPQPGHVMDIMATCVDVSGAAYPKEMNGKPITPMEGVSLRPGILGGKIERSQPIFWEHESNRAVREGDWKLVAVGGKPWRLYDMKADRSEQHDLAKQESERVAALTAKWNDWAARAQVLPLGGWKAEGKKATTKLSAKTRFELAQGDHLDRDDAPAIAKRAFTITAKYDSQKPNGVILAQGGAARGYALFVQNGKLTFMMRHSGSEANTVETADSIAGAHEVIAKLQPDGAMSLQLDGREVAKGKTSGPLATMPLDGLDVAADNGGLVGSYGETNSFDGTVQKVIVELAPQ